MLQIITGDPACLYLVTWEGVLPSEDRGPWRSLVSWDEVLAMMKDVLAVPNYMGRSASDDERGGPASLWLEEKEFRQ